MSCNTSKVDYQYLSQHKYNKTHIVPDNITQLKCMENILNSHIIDNESRFIYEKFIEDKYCMCV